MTVLNVYISCVTGKFYFKQYIRCLVRAEDLLKWGRGAKTLSGILSVFKLNLDYTVRVLRCFLYFSNKQLIIICSVAPLTRPITDPLIYILLGFNNNKKATQTKQSGTMDFRRKTGITMTAISKHEVQLHCTTV